MSKLSTFALAVAVSLGTTAMLANSWSSATPEENSEARLAADGAFRDGLYLGKLAAESGQSRRPAIGRWSTTQDRATFAAGYQRGYSQVLGATEP